MVGRYAQMSRAEAERFLAAYVDAMPGRRAAFVAEVGATGGPAAASLDGGRDSLVPLWEWALARIDADPGTAPRDDEVLWYDPDDQTSGQGLSAGLLRLADGLAYYLADCLLRAVPGARWAVGHSDAKRYVHQHKPVPHGFAMEPCPVHLALVMVAGARAGMPLHRAPERLRDLYDTWVGQAA